MLSFNSIFFPALRLFFRFNLLWNKPRVCCDCSASSVGLRPLIGYEKIEYLAPNEGPKSPTSLWSENGSFLGQDFWDKFADLWLMLLIWVPARSRENFQRRTIMKKISRVLAFVLLASLSVLTLPSNNRKFGLGPVWPEKNRQMSIKVAQKLFQ